MTFLPRLCNFVIVVGVLPNMSISKMSTFGLVDVAESEILTALDSTI